MRRPAADSSRSGRMRHHPRAGCAAILDERLPIPAVRAGCATILDERLPIPAVRAGCATILDERLPVPAVRAGCATILDERLPLPAADAPASSTNGWPGCARRAPVTIPGGGLQSGRVACPSWVAAARCYAPSVGTRARVSRCFLHAGADAVEDATDRSASRGRPAVQAGCAGADAVEDATDRSASRGVQPFGPDAPPSSTNGCRFQPFGPDAPPSSTNGCRFQPFGPDAPPSSTDGCRFQPRMRRHPRRTAAAVRAA
jgi:hypothetical protein